MGQEANEKKRAVPMRRFAVSAKLFAAAKPDAYFMHCLPAHPGEEVAQEVLDNPRCLIFDEAENRLHVQKAILTLLAQSARK
jgi:ornithine carbamoyltransferase